MMPSYNLSTSKNGEKVKKIRRKTIHGESNLSPQHLPAVPYQKAVLHLTG
jgi:hypothetical protein